MKYVIDKDGKKNEPTAYIELIENKNDKGYIDICVNGIIVVQFCPDGRIWTCGSGQLPLGFKWWYERSWKENL
jgi:hypothetical protein